MYLVRWELWEPRYICVMFICFVWRVRFETTTVKAEQDLGDRGEMYVYTHDEWAFLLFQWNEYHNSIITWTFALFINTLWNLHENFIAWSKFPIVLYVSQSHSVKILQPKKEETANEIWISYFTVLRKNIHNKKYTQRTNFFTWNYLYMFSVLFQCSLMSNHSTDCLLCPVQAVNSRLLIGEVHVWFQGSPCKIYGGKNRTGEGSSGRASYSICQLPFHQFTVLTYHQGLVQ